MALVDYSGSEESDEEEQTKAPESPKSKVTTTKPTFQKVVDSSNPHKVRINLPEPAQHEELDGPERPLKRVKVDSAGHSGFNSLLPAPKRTAGLTGGATSDRIRKGGLGVGINLKTGAAPGFSREPVEPVHTIQEDDIEPIEGGTVNCAPNFREIKLKLPTARESHSLLKPAEEAKAKGNATMFKPLSVARKPQKKKATPKEGIPSAKTDIGVIVQQSEPAPRANLFFKGDETQLSSISPTASGVYQPMIYTTTSNSISSPMEASGAPAPSEPPDPSKYQAPDSTKQSLISIASDLNLTPAQTRQLLGRQGNNNSSSTSKINIVNFNTDAEYAANEILRQSGETVQHNAVRAIAPGKHSLKQLVNAASNQKDALEESFASGRRNKKEAGSKYGW